MSINPGAPGFPYIFYPHKSMEVRLSIDSRFSRHFLSPGERACRWSAGSFVLMLWAVLWHLVGTAWMTFGVGAGV